MATFCERCGRSLHEGAKFCGGCGHTQAGADAGTSASEPAPPAPPAPVAPPAAAPTPPSGPPSGPPPAGPAAASGGGGSNQKLIIGLVAALLVAVIAVVVVMVTGGGDEKVSKKDREVLLESAATASPAPFTPDIQPVSATVPTTLAPAPTVPATTGRVAQGPFGGTGDNTLCDRELLVEFLTDPANSGIAREWARVLDIEVSEIPAYVRALIPTTLTADARVTNHTFENGRAVGYQAVLQSGTAVLVDTNGRLIARCRCGNPLLPPQEVTKPIYTGPKWEGFDPTVIVVVVPSPTPIYPPGGVGTLPPATGRTPTTTSPSFDDEEEEAIRRIKEPFEACVRSTNEPAASEPLFTPVELQQLIASLTYDATLIDQRTGTYRVVVTVPSQAFGEGDVTGDSGTWEVNLRDGTITPVDANAQEAAASCPGLA